MLYTRETLDRSTGALVTTHLGDWITVSELAQRYDIGPRKVRAILHHMGLLQREGRNYRLPHSAVRKGLGLRHDKPRSGHPFDVISPFGQALVDEAWAMTVEDYDADCRKDAGVDEARSALANFQSRRSRAMETQEGVCWLLDHYDQLTHGQVSEILGVTQQLVSRYAKIRKKQRAFNEREKQRKLPASPPMSVRRHLTQTSLEACVDC